MNENDLKNKVISILETIVDPEIGIDVYNLGMIYDIEVIDDKHIKIKLTLTTPICPLANIIPMLIIEELKNKLGVETNLELVFDPPWTPDKMTEKGRRLFKEKYGYDIVEAYRSIYGVK
ncbi:MAG: metal-sulfur cluster assembly factor [Desulfurococcaceae archaeon]|uniref:DUF59 domain-containing protein n=1 Tax=Staphylothermus marinus TaxID=2280 RepID=A0A7C4D9A6_STAMA